MARTLDDPLDDEWAAVYPGYGGSFLACPECAALVPESTGGGFVELDGKVVHVAWHKKLRRLLALLEDAHV